MKINCGPSWDDDGGLNYIYNHQIHTKPQKRDLGPKLTRFPYSDKISIRGK